MLTELLETQLTTAPDRFLPRSPRVSLLLRRGRPATQDLVCLSVVVLGAGSPREVRRPHKAGLGAEECQGEDPLWVGGGKQKAHRAAVVSSDQSSALRPDRIHHRAHVVHALLQRGCPLDLIREACAAFVERDHSGKRCELRTQSRPSGRKAPYSMLQRAGRNLHDVDPSVPFHSIGDVEVAALRISRLRLHR